MTLLRDRWATALVTLTGACKTCPGFWRTGIPLPATFKVVLFSSTAVATAPHPISRFSIRRLRNRQVQTLSCGACLRRRDLHPTAYTRTTSSRDHLYPTPPLPGYRTAAGAFGGSDRGRIPFFMPLLGTGVMTWALVSQSPDLFTQRFTAPPSQSTPDEFFREVPRNDPWVETLMCAELPRRRRVHQALLYLLPIPIAHTCP
jgi:hypothetical protein